MKILHKIFLGMIFVAGLPLVISGWWTTKLVKKENLQRIFLLLSSSAQNLEDAISRYINVNVNSVKASLKYFSPEKEYILTEIMFAFKDISYISVNGSFVGDISFSKKDYGNGIFLESNAIVYSSPEIKVAMSIEPIKKILNSFSIGKTGTASMKKISKDAVSEIAEIEENGKKYLSAYYRVKDSDFAVFVTIEKSEIEKLWQNILYQVIFWIGVGIILAFSSAFVIAGGLTTPLRKIAEAAREYAKLNFSTKVLYKSKDEIGEVSQAFLVMSNEIQRAWEEIKMWNTELEKRVEERTIELKKTHDNLLVAEKIAAVGTLGAGVSHEINNPLAAALGFVQILKKKVTDGNLKKYLETVSNNLQRVKTIVERLRQFSEVQMKASYKLVRIDELLKNILSEIPDDLKGAKIIDASLHPVSEIYSDEEQFRTAIYEIVKNALLASKSKVVIRTYQKDENVFIEVEDDGEEGIPKEVMAKIFDPFFTFKKWEGIGLGLTIARAIIQNVRGTIEVESTPGRTIFEISINLNKNKEIGEFLKEEIGRIKTHLV